MTSHVQQGTTPLTSYLLSSYHTELLFLACVAVDTCMSLLIRTAVKIIPDALVIRLVVSLVACRAILCHREVFVLFASSLLVSA